MPDVTPKIGQASEPGGSKPRHFANLLNERLAQLHIEPQKRASHLAALDDIERPGKRLVSVSSATHWVNSPRESWLNASSYRNLAHHLRMPGMPLVEATAFELDITWGARRRESSAWWVPPIFHALPDEDKESAQRAFAEMVEGLAIARGIRGRR